MAGDLVHPGSGFVAKLEDRAKRRNQELEHERQMERFEDFSMEVKQRRNHRHAHAKDAMQQHAELFEAEQLLRGDELNKKINRKIRESVAFGDMTDIQDLMGWHL